MTVSMFAASDFCQRWESKKSSWRHTSEGGFDRRLYEVAPIAPELAEAFLVQHHYLASMPSEKWVYGLLRGQALQGVAVLSNPTNKHTLLGMFPDLAPYHESTELGRFCLLDAVPANAETWFLGQVWRQVAREGVRGVISFSDPVERTMANGTIAHVGHYGAIYQAANAVYTGKSRKDTFKLLPNGLILSRDSLNKFRDGKGAHYVEPQLLKQGAAPRRPSETPTEWTDRVLPAITRPLAHSGNHRYAFRIGKNAASVRIARASGAYPKGLAA